jgi:hypothetical protein
MPSSGKKRNIFSGVILVTTLISFLLISIFIPLISLITTPSLTFPPQDLFTTDPDVQKSVLQVAKDWNVARENLRVFAVFVPPDYPKIVAIIDESTLSSAEVWVPTPGLNAGDPHSQAEINKGIHIINQHRPRSIWEKALVKRFYTQDGWAMNNKAIILNIHSSDIFARSLIDGTYLTIPTNYARTEPVFSLAIQFEYR